MYSLAVWLGKATAWLTRHVGRGHGSALPGLIAEKFYPNFLTRLLGDLPDGVVLVSGTNGKTTTTKIVADLLTADGKQVFTNPSGSNFTRGVISAALPLIRRGRLNADIAVLELDEAYAPKFAAKVPPRYALLLNVLRDQLDRFGEIDHTGELLQQVAESTTGVVILNEDDPRISAIGRDKRVKAKLAWFGSAGAAAENYKTDEELHGVKSAKRRSHSGAVVLTKLDDNRAAYRLDGQNHLAELRLFGIHNALNCAAALATVRAVEGFEFDMSQTMKHLANVTPAFGRGEILDVAGVRIRLVLVKNPSGFQLALNSSRDIPTMIAINDRYADGRDVSWLWDVDFPNWQAPLRIAGTRAYDLMLRLYYGGQPLTHLYHPWRDRETAAGVPADSAILGLDYNTKAFLDELKHTSTSKSEGQIFATYTAMLQIRETLLGYAN